MLKTVAARPEASRKIARAIGGRLELVPEKNVFEIKQGHGQLDQASV
jgi:hypothetical protein